MTPVDNAVSTRILSLDGGGVRGLFQAAFLSRVEEDTAALREFSAIAGTSTGSIIAAALALGKTPQEAQKLYERLATRIFGIPPWRCTAALFFGGARYSSKTLKQCILSGLPEAAKPMGECSPRLLVTGTNLETHSSVIFDSCEDSGMKVIDAVMSSCAAPTYFRPQTVQSCRMMDGGLWANNPSMAALIHLGSDLDAVRILSIGTGRTTCVHDLMPRGRILQWGIGHSSLLDWSVGAFEILLSIGSAAVEAGVNKLLGSKVLRINPEISPGISLDDSVRALKVLPSLAATEWRTRRREVCAWLEDR